MFRYTSNPILGPGRLWHEQRALSSLVEGPFEREITEVACCRMGIVRIDHVQLAMPAGLEAEAVNFYEGVLGIPHVPKPDHLAIRGGSWFENGDVKVHLGVDSRFQPATKAHPAFIVDNVHTLAAAAINAGFAVNDDEPLDGFDRVYVTDPFGNRIELMQPNA